MYYLDYNVAFGSEEEIAEREEASKPRNRKQRNLAKQEARPSVDTSPDKEVTNGLFISNIRVVKESDKYENGSNKGEKDVFCIDDRDYSHWVVRLQLRIQELYAHLKLPLQKILHILLYVGYFVYLICACIYSITLAKPLLIITALVLVIKLYYWIGEHYGDTIDRCCCTPIGKKLDNQWHWLKWIVYSTFVLGIVYYLLFRVITTWRQIQSLAGMALFLLFPWLTCVHPKQINWRPVIWGMALQFLLGVFVLRWEPGYMAIRWLAQEINKYLFYSLAGSAAVFGDPWFILHAFLMFVIPLVVHVGCTTAVFFHFGLVQSFSRKLGWLMKKTLQTTSIESISLCVNIFLSVLDTMLMLKSYFPLLTPSEFHCFLVGAHSTIAGFAFGLFVIFGVNAQHLLTGAVMSAPAAVAISKLNFPETQESLLKNDDSFEMGNGGAPNIFLAAAKGAWEAGKGGSEILLQTLAFVALLLLADDIVVWMGSLVGIDTSLADIVGLFFVPFAYLMGVEKEDIEEVSKLLGLKVLANEMVGYLVLGRYIRQGRISERSSAIATYAMCGFSSIGTIIIFVGVWRSVYPAKAEEVVKVMPRLIMNSNLACFLTATIASVFYDESLTSGTVELPPAVVTVVQAIPSYKDILSLLNFYQYN